jgi:hypothetical protein
MSMLRWQRIHTIGVCAPPCVAKVRRRRQFEPRRVGLGFVSSTEFSSRRRRRQFEPRSSTKATEGRGPVEFEASQVVSAFYDAYNRRAIPELLELFDQDVVYHDMAVYDDPFVGKAELAAYFDKIERLVPGDIRFVVDDITGSDAKKVGVIWHVELESEKEGFVSLPFYSKAKRNLWIGVMFLTNFFAPWYMARRMVPDVYTNFQTVGGADETPAALKLGGSATKLIAATSLSVGLVSVYWIIAGRSEYGPLEDRVGFFLEMSSNNRVFWAFLLDAFLYSIWQHVLLRDLGAKGWLSRVPLFGLACWLLLKEQPASDDK